MAGNEKKIRPEQYFVLRNGKTLKNIYELRNSLIGMDDETFQHHVNSGRNDFANWIRGVFKDEELANKISKLKSKSAIIKELSKKTETSQVKKQQKSAATVKKGKAGKSGAEQSVAERAVKLAKKRKKKKTLKVARREEEKKEESKEPKESKEEPKTEQKLLDYKEELSAGPSAQKTYGQSKIDEILAKEAEIAKREEKIQETEEKIEKELASLRENKSSGETKFFSKEFVQGLVTGFLITLIISLIYIKFIYF